MKNSKNKLKIKNSKGITLIALVVTIIILIILAGVSINLVLGENGIITKAKQAKSITEESQLNEQAKLNEIVEYMENNGGISNTSTEYAPYDNPYIPAGFTHIGTADWNSGYQIQETSTENIFVWVPCVLDQAKVKEGDTVQTFKKTLPTTTATTDSYYMYNKSNYTITGDENPASDIKTSVGKYGGFYIAAYEAGIAGTKENSYLSTKTETNGKVKPLSKAGCGVWNYISRTDALKVAESMVNTSDGVKSGLISGECWDTTLQWMVNSSTNATNEPNLEYDIDSTNKGWYNNVSKWYINVTGYELSKVNNIYDMAGNAWEWTTENCTLNGNSGLATRGGNYNYSGSFYPVAYRMSHNANEDDGVTFRVVLYK